MKLCNIIFSTFLCFIIYFVELAQHNDATILSISIQKIGELSCLFLSADNIVRHLKKLIRYGKQVILCNVSHALIACPASFLCIPFFGKEVGCSNLVHRKHKLILNIEMQSFVKWYVMCFWLLCRANPGRNTTKARFARGWTSLADKMLLLTKVTQEEVAVYKIGYSAISNDGSSAEEEEPPRMSGIVSLDSNCILDLIQSNRLINFFLKLL